MAEEEFRFERITVRDGLPHSMIFNILQDSEGFMWFGTVNGIAKFDGYEFKQYIKSDSSGKKIDAIFIGMEDAQGYIWFGSGFGNLFKYDPREDNFKCYYVPFKSIYMRNVITSICEDSFGNLWLGTNGCGLIRFKKDEEKFYSVNYLKSDNDDSKIAYIAALHNSEMTIINQEGLYIFNIQNEAIQLLDTNLAYPKSKFLVPPKNIFRISDGMHLLLATHGLKLYNEKTKEIESIEHFTPIEKFSFDRINSLCCDNFGKVWLSQNDGRLFRLELNIPRISILLGDVGKEFNEGKNKIIDLFCDKSGVVWISVEGYGLYKVDTLRKKFNHLKPEVKTEKKLIVMSLTVWGKNNLFIGTKMNGLFKYSLETGKSIDYKTNNSKGECLSTLLIRFLFKDSENNIWAVTREGLFKYDDATDTFEKYSQLKKEIFLIHAITEYYDKESHYLLLGGPMERPRQVPLRVDTKRNIVSEFEEFNNIVSRDLAENVINGLFFDKRNNLWISFYSKKGIYKLSMNDFTFKKYIPELSNSQIYSRKMFEDKDNNLWIPSKGCLLKYDHEKDLFIEYSFESEENRSIYGIEKDNDDNIWLSSFNSIIKFNPDSKEFRKYDYNDSLLNEEFISNICRDENGILYFGGTNGIDYFDPNEIKDNPSIPNIVITDFEIFNKTIDGSPDNRFLKINIAHADEINLTHKENVISFKFAALIYNKPQKNQYAYMMEGFDKDWVYCGTRRTATYTNLNPGEYIFRVKGSNNDGVWNEEGTSIKVTITPPYWKTWWFKGLGLLSAAAAAGMTYKNRMDKLEKEKNDQEEFSRKLIESQENERKRIASELHDTIAHDILVTQNKAAMGLRHSKDVEKVENTLKEISELSSAAIKDVRNISYNLHPHQLEKIGFTKTVKSIVNEVNNATDIDFDFESDLVDGYLSKESEINLFRVIQESINNMIKHSGADKAEVKLMVSEDYILVSLKDNGKGFNMNEKNPKHIKGGFGLSGMNERIKYMKGEIHIETGEDRGTAIMIRIPVSKT